MITKVQPGHLKIQGGVYLIHTDCILIGKLFCYDVRSKPLLNKIPKTRPLFRTLFNHKSGQVKQQNKAGGHNS